MSADQRLGQVVIEVKRHRIRIGSVCEDASKAWTAWSKVTGKVADAAEALLRESVVYWYSSLRRQGGNQARGKP